MPRISHRRAAQELATLDPAMGRLIDVVGPPAMRPRKESAFEALARAIVFQQLSGKAAATIYGRVETALGSVTPESVMATADESLRGAGLSAAKLAGIRDLSAKALDGTVPIESLGQLSDEDLIERLVVVRGIGRWTAEMFLIFQLRRLDVWPVDDLGVRKGYARIYGLTELPPPKELDALGERFRPYRSVAAWYCWRATELTDLPG